ncbi:MAG: hypothetical protein HQ546_09780 [Planctomycetes bacterium]|nr:hypothetical protein [Planctomycetota bacterium]
MAMKVFLAGIIQGSKIEAQIHSQDWRGPIKQAMLKYLPQAQVYDHYDEHPDSITYPMPLVMATLAEGIRRARQCDLLVAYLPSASMGTAIEMYEAACNGAVVLTISPLEANWVVRAYSDHIFPDLDAFRAFLASGKIKEVFTKKTK